MVPTPKILVVEDDQELLSGLKIRLAANGYDVAAASGVALAVSAAQGDEPDLMLLDIGLPDGDGFLVMQSLKDLAALASIPVIVITGRDPFVNRRRAFEAGAFAYFQKPFDNDQLLATIARALRGSRSMPPIAPSGVPAFSPPYC